MEEGRVEEPLPPPPPPPHAFSRNETKEEDTSKRKQERHHQHKQKVSENAIEDKSKSTRAKGTDIARELESSESDDEMSWSRDTLEMSHTYDRMDSLMHAVDDLVEEVQCDYDKNVADGRKEEEDDLSRDKSDAKRAPSSSDSSRIESFRTANISGIGLLDRKAKILSPPPPTSELSAGGESEGNRAVVRSYSRSSGSSHEEEREIELQREVEEVMGRFKRAETKGISEIEDDGF